MFPAASGADLEVYIGNASNLIPVAQLDANGNERHAESLTINNQPNIDALFLLGSESRDANVTNLMSTISIPFLAGTTTDLLDTVQGLDDLWLVIIGTDEPMTHRCFPVVFGGMPWNSPTDGTIRRPAEFAQNEVGLVGRPVTGKDRVQKVSLVGGVEHDFSAVNDTDRILAVVTAYGGNAQTLKLTDGTKDITTDINLSRTGIHELTAESGEEFSSATKILLAGDTTNTATVYFIAGPSQTKGDG